MPTLDLLEITGSERATWLQGMVTQDVVELPEGQGRYGLVLTIKGRILADFQVYAAPEALLLVIPRAQRDALVAHLDSRLIIEDVTLPAASTHRIVTLQGPQSGALLGQPASHVAEITVDGVRCWALARSHSGETGWDLAVPSDSENAIIAALVAKGAVLASPDALEAARLEAAIPRFGAELDDSVIALEALVRDAIHWSKGCYLGQEVIARMAHRGHTNRELRRLLLKNNHDVPAGAELFLELGGKAVGRVTSSAPSPRKGATLAFAMLRRKAFEPGTRLLLADGTSAVVDDAVIRGHVVLQPDNDPSVTRNARQTGLLR